jgi:hypothetical protein
MSIFQMRGLPWPESSEVGGRIAHRIKFEG